MIANHVAISSLCPVSMSHKCSDCVQVSDWLRGSGVNNGDVF
jgi:hypothetical protein